MFTISSKLSGRNFLWATALILLGCGTSVCTAITPTDLACEYVTEAMGVDAANPRLYWKLESSQRAQRQSAYQIVVASTPENLATPDLWDSGRTTSDATTHIRYGGRPLRSSQTVWWRVRVWDQDGTASRWSRPASWTMGVLRPEEWAGRWISAKGATAHARPSIGYHAAETRDQLEVKWLQFDLGESLPLDRVRLHPKYHMDKPGFGFPLRFKVELSEDPAFAAAATLADHTSEDFGNPGTKPVEIPANGQTGRYLRITATKLWHRDWAYCFALSQVEIVSRGTNVSQKAKVSAKDSVEAHGWGIAGVNDGLGFNDGSTSGYQSLLARREFGLGTSPIRRATVHISGLGHYELFLNGHKVGRDLLAPGWTKYDRTCLYDTFDVTGLLKKDANAIGLILGNGMYNVPGGRYIKFKGTFGPIKAIAQLRLEYRDGRIETLGTDDQWRVASGPITFSCVYGGEDYDARLEPKGWSLPRFDDSGWEPAQVVGGPGGRLRGLTCAAPPIKTWEALKPVRTIRLKPDLAVYDLGQNASLMPRLQARGPAGSVVRITPAELLRDDGTVDRGSVGGGKAYWQYTLDGSGRESWFPKFFYHGARYLQVELFPGGSAGLPIVESLEGVVVHTASAAVGEFECSSDLFNRIRKLVRWAQRSNLVSLITDCPHREKLGWLEQYHLNGPSLRYEFDLAQLFTKGMNDMADSQLENGLVPDIAPEYVRFDGGFRDSPEWGSAAVQVPWQQYLFTGRYRTDVPLLRPHATLCRLPGLPSDQPHFVTRFGRLV